MAYSIIWQRKKQVYSCRELWIEGNRQYKFCTVVSEVSSFMGEPVTQFYLVFIDKQFKSSEHFKPLSVHQWGRYPCFSIVIGVYISTMKKNFLFKLLFLASLFKLQVNYENLLIDNFSLFKCLYVLCISAGWRLGKNKNNSKVVFILMVLRQF